MSTILSNPWIISIAGGVLAGIIIYVISSYLKTNTKTDEFMQSKNVIKVKNEGKIISNGKIRLGNEKFGPDQLIKNSENKIIVEGKGKISAKDDIVVGESNKDQEDNAK